MEQLKALVDTLEDAFPQYKVFTEKVKAVGNLSCFYVKASDSSLQKELNEVYRLIEKFEIAYYDADKSNKKCVSMNENLDYHLKKVGGLAGKKNKFEIKDGVLKVVYEYSCRVRLGETVAKSKMNEMKIGMEMVLGG